MTVFVYLQLLAEDSVQRAGIKIKKMDDTK